MHVLAFLLSAPFIEVAALFLSIVWMMRNQKDRVRPLLVMALTVNLFYGILLSIFMGAEGGLLPWKYDRFLFALDSALGVPWLTVARSLQGVWRVPLATIYQLMVPMMVCWFLIVRKSGRGGALVLAYVAELVTGPLLYAVVPACGPAYALGSDWLHGALPVPGMMLLAGMPNAFPSLHIATALVLLLFAPGKWSRAVAGAFFAATVLATISTGEHYVIDLVPGLAFGCYAAEAGLRRFRWALSYLAITVFWCVLVRFESAWLLSHRLVLKAMVAGTLAAIGVEFGRQWLFWDSMAVASADEFDAAPEQLPPVHMARP
jgi:hypothetical protein